MGLAVIAAGSFSSGETSNDRRVGPLVWGGEQKLLASDAAELATYVVEKGKPFLVEVE